MRKIKLDAEVWVRAIAATYWRRGLIQGFTYGNKNIVRDTHLVGEKQEVWSRSFDESTRDQVHEDMMFQIEVLQTKIILEEYNKLVRQKGKEFRRRFWGV